MDMHMKTRTKQKPKKEKEWEKMLRRARSNQPDSSDSDDEFVAGVGRVSRYEQFNFHYQYDSVYQGGGSNVRMEIWL